MQELIVIFIVALLVFGPKRLPELGRTLGKGILELRKAMEGIKDQVHAESEALSGQAEATGERGVERNGPCTEPGPLPADEKPFGTEEEKKGGDAGTVNHQADKAPQEETKGDKADAG